MKISHTKALEILKQHAIFGGLNPVAAKEEDAVLTHLIQNFPEKVAFLTDDEHEQLVSHLLNGVGAERADDVEIHYDGLPFAPVTKPKFKFIDLFAGIGGFRIALQEQGGKCVLSSDWDKEAKVTYANNFGEVPFGDIRLFTGPEMTDEEIDQYIPDHDILCGGFPCQPFSRAGVSARNSLGRLHGFEDKNQGNLFFDIMRIVKVKRPRVLFLENVKNLKSHDGGNTFEVIRKSIEEMGYTFNHEVIDSRNVAPQKRQRCYMVAFRDENVEFAYPNFEGTPIALRTILEKNVPETYTISDRLWAGHQSRTKRNAERGTGFSALEADLDKPANTLVARYYKDGKECLVPQKGKNPRKLTPREAARLMGYPDKFIVSVKTNSAYRQFGNSLVVPVVRGIAKEIVTKLPIEEKIHVRR